MVGATSDSGRVVAQALEERGQAVRPVSRQHGVSMDDAVALGQAFDGAYGAYLMLPFDMAAPDLHARERELCARLVQAMQGTGLRRAVVLSGLSADLRRGSALGAALLEEAVAALGIPELVFLRAGWFMENFAKGLNFAAQADSGVFCTPFQPHRPLPIVSAADVGRRAAELLMADTPGERVQEVLGAGSHTMAEATAVLARATGRVAVSYRQVPLHEARAGMVAAGLSASFADAVLDTARSFNDGEPWGRQQRTPKNTTATTLEQWAREHLASARAAT
ncbi:MAG: NmrA family NAD(P)-binding protein [Rhizobacter sp.]|nr:NmrA family NAD(P)-binding protein [Rhizobacter sp.]